MHEPAGVRDEAERRDQVREVAKSHRRKPNLIRHLGDPTHPLSLRCPAQHSDTCCSQFEQANFEGVLDALLLGVGFCRYTFCCGREFKALQVCQYLAAYWKPHLNPSWEKTDHGLHRRRLVAWLRVARAPEMNHHELNRGRRRLVP